jgi:hypothetical protein
LNSKKIGDWLTLVANFGVVIGLFLLVLEFRESQNLAETEASVRRLNQIQEAFVEMAVSETLPAIKVKASTEGVQSLTNVELYRLQTWEESVRRRMRSQYIEFLGGYLDEATAEEIVRSAAELLPFWEELGYQLGDNRFEQAISAAAGR